jgi:hypothetical protein
MSLADLVSLLSGYFGSRNDELLRALTKQLNDASDKLEAAIKGAGK